jgi:hypothetical protein
LSAVALKDKGSRASSLLLGKVGERRFGPRVGRAHAFTEIVPADEGEVWLRVEQREFVSFTDRNGAVRTPTFVFENESAVVSAAYTEFERDD